MSSTRRSEVEERTRLYRLGVIRQDPSDTGYNSYVGYFDDPDSYRLLRYDKDGAENRRYSAPDVGRDIAVTPEGEVVTSANNSESLVKLNSGFEVEWSYQVQKNQYDIRDIAIDTDGYAYAILFTGSDEPLFIIKVEPDGSGLVWEKSYSYEGNRGPGHMEYATSSSKVIYSIGPSVYSLDESGDLVDSYNPNIEHVSDIAVTPGGEVSLATTEGLTVLDTDLTELGSFESEVGGTTIPLRATAAGPEFVYSTRTADLLTFDLNANLVSTNSAENAQTGMEVTPLGGVYIAARDTIRDPPAEQVFYRGPDSAAFTQIYTLTAENSNRINEFVAEPGKPGAFPEWYSRD